MKRTVLLLALLIAGCSSADGDSGDGSALVGTWCYENGLADDDCETCWTFTADKRFGYAEHCISDADVGEGVPNDTLATGIYTANDSLVNLAYFQECEWGMTVDSTDEEQAVYVIANDVLTLGGGSYERVDDRAIEECD